MTVKLPYKNPCESFIIWADEIEAIQRATGEWDYFATFAISIPPGASLKRCLAVTPFTYGIELDLAEVARVYDGTQTKADPAILKAFGDAAPVFPRARYAVFERMHLAPFRQRIPSIWFPSVEEDVAP